ncbi:MULTISPECIES: GntR family transcriptional regulator [Enterococcus]|uniref:GntR family transcriptional regulator n=1 Tax=Enterococcus alcedinis TaxID=1274384 RepID=A0A917JGX7_9ENTE|nr:GntR family transcriptional regulator [Enterococcus alcedinis]MBP2101953.1 DNA-binding GntR family transcriptional regulator [Enterococcus alcedinis]GGI65516.1 GntR family transcriptional regulator [Enterococcus alcedinis]
MIGKKVLYLEVANALKKDILKEVYPVGSLIPTENELEMVFSVSKITIRKAVEILVQEGYLEKKSGIGTTVISNRPFNKLSKAVSFSTILENEGLNIRKEFIAIEEVAKEDLTFNLTGLGPKVVKLTRLYYLDDKPYILFEHYLPNLDDFSSISKDEASLYRWLSHNGYVINYIKDDFDLIEATSEIKKQLSLTTPYVLRRHRYSYSRQQELVEYSIGYYDVTQHAYSIEYEV